MSALGDVSAFPDVLRTGREPLVPLVGLQWAMARARVHSLVQALYRLGLSEEVADLLDQLSPAQMMRIAQGNMLLCRFRFDDAMLWSLLADHGEGVQEEGGERSASRLHAAILRSGRFEETLDERA